MTGPGSRTEVVRTAVRVEGVVQGVGFRPFVYSLATRLGFPSQATTREYWFSTSERPPDSWSMSM
jgi:hypothetical protein